MGKYRESKVVSSSLLYIWRSHFNFPAVPKECAGMHYTLMDKSPLAGSVQVDVFTTSFDGLPALNS